MTDHEFETNQEQPEAGVIGAEAEFSSDSLALFLAELSRYPLLRAAEEVSLAKRIERGDKQAKDTMVNSNLPLVVSIAKRYRNRGVPFLEGASPSPSQVRWVWTCARARGAVGIRR